MKPAISLFLLVFASFLWVACGQQSQRETDTEVVQTVEPQKFEDLIRLADHAQVLDVRTPREYQVGYIPGADNNNIANAAFVSNAQKLDKNRPVFVYCKTGVRSAHAAEQLAELGFKEVYNLEGGISNWQRVGLKVEMQP